MRAPTTPLSAPEFVTLLALMTSIVALATDIMLPALDRIGRELGVANPNDAQIVISALFIGFAVGQILAGPLSDAFGRRRIILVGYAIFIAGAALSMLTEDFTTMLIGRMLQGLGAAGPRVVATALIRDCYEGRAMARILSVIMAIFILVPAIAPAIGQAIILATGWRETFGFLLVIALITVVWFGLRQPETLAPEARRPFRARTIGQGIAEATSHRVSVGTTLAMGCVFAPFLGYLSSAQQIFQVTYGTGEMFPLWFATAALAFGLASVVNARLVMRLGMRFLTGWAITGLVAFSALFLVVVLAAGGQPPFWVFLLWLGPVMFFLGISFGNLNALAMEPLGHMAGLGAALIGSMSTLIALPIGWYVGASYDGGITALVTGFTVFGLLALGLFRWGAPKQSVASL